MSAGRSSRTKLLLSLVLAAAIFAFLFLPGAGGEPGMAPDLVRQSLWFDKTSIRTGPEPERLPYTVYDLPLAPAPPDGQTGRVR